MTDIIDFPPSPGASVCGFGIGLPRIHFPFPPSIPSLAFLTNLIPIPFLGFRLTCDPSKPIDVTAGLNLPFGGGRTPNGGTSPFNNDSYP